MPIVYRSMKEDSLGLPAVGAGARSLGIRPGIDVPVLEPDDIVEPFQGGLSVSPDTPLNLPHYRRPPEWYGVGKDPVWQIDTDDLGSDLVFRPDPENDGHGLIEPSRPMKVTEFDGALARSKTKWQKA